MKRARFYCENCRKEVRWDAKICPHCGRFFSAVRCPSCGFTGKSKLFVVGCPSCGYAGAGDVTKLSAESMSGADVDTYSLESVFGSSDATGKRRKRRLPAWVYAAAIVALVITFIVLIVVYALLPG